MFVISIYYHEKSVPDGTLFLLLRVLHGKLKDFQKLVSALPRITPILGQFIEQFPAFMKKTVNPFQLIFEEKEGKRRCQFFSSFARFFSAYNSGSGIRRHTHTILDW